MAAGWLRDTAPLLPLALQTHPPERCRRVVCVHADTVTSRHLASGRRRPASWGKAKSGLKQASLLWPKLGPRNYKLCRCPQLKWVKPAPGTSLSSRTSGPPHRAPAPDWPLTCRVATNTTASPTCLPGTTSTRLHFWAVLPSWWRRGGGVHLSMPPASPLLPPPS